MKNERTIVPTKSHRSDHFIIQIALICGIMLAWLSIARYAAYNAGMRDLGNMVQSIWTGTQGQPLIRTAAWMGQRSRLNVHVELIYYMFVPFYKLWPDPRLLLSIQAALFVAGALPIYRITMRRTQSRFAARCMAFVYLFYPTAQTSVLFDFHGDTLAMPLLLFALDALDARAWRSYAIYALLALSCKFYVALPLAGMGLVLMLWEPAHNLIEKRVLRKAGIATVFIAGLYGTVAFLVIRPMFATHDTLGLSNTTGWYVSNYFGQLSALFNTLGDRFLSFLVVFGPVFLIVWRGWKWLLPGLPVAFAMLISTGPGGAHDFRYHHYALVVPFIMMATIDGVNMMIDKQQQNGKGTKEETQEREQQPGVKTPRPRRKRNWRADLMVTAITVFLFNALLVDTPLNPLFWMALPGEGLDPSAYGITKRDAIKNAFVASEEVPQDAPLATSMILAPHQANREYIYMVRYPEDPGAEFLPQFLPFVDYVMADALFDYFIPLGENSYGGGVDYEREAIGVTMRDPNFSLIKAQDGLLLFARDAAAKHRLLQRVDILEGMAPAPMTLFGSQISLINADFASLGEQRFRATFDWTAADPSGLTQNYVAVSTLGGVDGHRIVHLPTYALLPTRRWPVGSIVRETFDVDVKDLAPGRYIWHVGWYRLNHPYSYATDERSLLAESQPMIVGTIEVEKKHK
jgi:uncharacterized membrane protein